MDNYKTEMNFFTSLFDKYRESFILFAYSYVRDRDAAEDIWMDAIIEYWEKRETLLPNTNIPAYILTIVKNKSLNYLRHITIKSEIEITIHKNDVRELHLRISSLEACEPSELFADDVKKIIQETFGKLPEQTRRIFYLSRFKNKKNREIAEQLNISIKTVEFHISKALKLFYSQLKDYLYIFLG
ncbi:MAG: RNA polymerase sigma-70 factor [Tannerellaceae bacterium]|nr:RNA polymerase sigma-70 factor [Tannerellaceae bacterium]